MKHIMDRYYESDVGSPFDSLSGIVNAHILRSDNIIFGFFCIDISNFFTKKYNWEGMTNAKWNKE